MSNRDGNFLKIIVSLLLCSMGIFKSKTNSLITNTVYMICMIYCLFGAFIGFLTATGTSDKITSLTSFLLILSGMIIYSIVFWSRREIRSLLRLLKGDGIHIPNIIDQTGEFVNNKIILLYIVYFFSAICFVAQPIINFSFISDEAGLRVIPFWYSCGKHTEIAKILKMFCWQTDTKVEIIFMNTLQVLLFALIYTVCSFGGIFAIIVMAELHMHTNRFKLEVKKLIKYMNSYTIQCNGSTKNQSTKISKVEYENEINYQFIIIIEYQHYLRRCARGISATLENLISFFISEFFASAILLTFMIFNGVEDRAFFQKFVEYVCCVHGLISFAMACYFAQIISELNEVIFYEIMQIPWYEQDLKFRKLYINVLTQNCAPIEMKLYNVIPLNLGFFVSTLKSAYSILNLMFLKIKK